MAHHQFNFYYSLFCKEAFLKIELWMGRVWKSPLQTNNDVQAFLREPFACRPAKGQGDLFPGGRRHV